ncbi:MAG: hypothetical protein AAGU74_12770 [Bacillota bacterium]
MRKHSLFVLVVVLVALLSACGGGLPGASDLEVTPTPSASPLPQTIPNGKETLPPKNTPAPRAFSAEELLSAAELEKFVGQPVEASFDPVEVSETGETSGTYTYDIPHEGIDVTTTFFTSLYLTQNSMIAPSELEKGHDAEWAFEDFRTTYSDRIADFTVRGFKAFYVTVNSDVHVLFQDYYIIVGFRIDDTDFEANLGLNKSIASFVIDKIALSDASLT